MREPTPRSRHGATGDWAPPRGQPQPAPRDVRSEPPAIDDRELLGLARPSPREPLDLRRYLSGVVHAVGIARIAAGFAALVLALVVGWWLLRPPPVPIEDTIPLASPSDMTAPPDAASSAGGSDGELLVHVAGAVRRPGVYRFDADARVADAVDRAGGASRRADLDGVNLAAPLTDGQQIRVPRRGEPVMSSSVGGSAVPTGPIDLNSADLAALDALPGIGPATAAAIIAYREESGPFLSVEDLLDVPGIGPAKLDAIRDLVTT